MVGPIWLVHAGERRKPDGIGGWLAQAEVMLRQMSHEKIYGKVTALEWHVTRHPPCHVNRANREGECQYGEQQALHPD